MAAVSAVAEIAIFQGILLLPFFYGPALVALFVDTPDTAAASPRLGTDWVTCQSSAPAAFWPQTAALSRAEPREAGSLHLLQLPSDPRLLH